MIGNHFLEYNDEYKLYNTSSYHLMLAFYLDQYKKVGNSKVIRKTLNKISKTNTNYFWDQEVQKSKLHFK